MSPEDGRLGRTLPLTVRDLLTMASRADDLDLHSSITNPQDDNDTTDFYIVNAFRLFDGSG